MIGATIVGRHVFDMLGPRGRMVEVAAGGDPIHQEFQATGIEH